MKYLLFLCPLLVLALSLFGPLLDAKLSRETQARAVSRRLTICLWLVAILSLAALIFSPHRQLVLLVTAPSFVLISTLRYLWRTRWRELWYDRPPVDLDQMKRAKVRPAVPSRS